MRLKLCATAAVSATWSCAGAICASVVTIASSVAIFRWIMPEPLQQPLIVTVLPPIASWRLATLGRVSVVMIAWATKGAPWNAPGVVISAIPLVTLSIGRWRPITPVESTSTWSGRQPSASAVAAAMVRVSSRPRGPVTALALPALVITARISAALLASTCWS